MSTYLQLRQNVLDYGFSSPRYLTAVGRWINEAQQYIAKNSVLPTNQSAYTFPIVTGTQSYSLPSNFVRTITVYREDGDSLIILDEVENDRQTATFGLTDRGTVDSYFMYNNRILFYPIPSSAQSIAMDYWSLPSDMALDADVPSIPTQYHHLLEAYALKKAYERENDYDAAKYWNGEFLTGMSILQSEAQRSTREKPRQMPGTWSNI